MKIMGVRGWVDRRKADKAAREISTNPRVVCVGVYPEAYWYAVGDDLLPGGPLVYGQGGKAVRLSDMRERLGYDVTTQRAR